MKSYLTQLAFLKNSKPNKITRNFRVESTFRICRSYFEGGRSYWRNFDDSNVGDDQLPLDLEIFRNLIDNICRKFDAENGENLICFGGSSSFLDKGCFYFEVSNLKSTQTEFKWAILKFAEKLKVVIF